MSGVFRKSHAGLKPYVMNGQNTGRSHTPTIVGGIIGGAIGNAVGSGDKNKKVGAVVGSILGMSIGHDIGRKNHRKHSHVEYRDVERCENSLQGSTGK